MSRSALQMRRLALVLLSVVGVGLATLGSTASADVTSCRAQAEVEPGDDGAIAQSDGIGGSGISGAEADGESAQSDGVGGTGIFGGDEDGVGGSGVRLAGEDGIGGTGIFGTVTGFGSICVNGLRVEYDDATPLDVDGVPGSVADLEVGQVVLIDARPGADGGLRAGHIGIRHALVGPVTAVDASRRRVEVMGQWVELEPGVQIRNASDGEAVDLTRLATGVRIEVSGLRRGENELVASHVLLASSGGPDQVIGRARVADQTGQKREGQDGEVRIGGTRVQVNEAWNTRRREGREDAMPLMVRGRWNREQARLVPDSVDSAIRFRERPERLSIEGYYADQPDQPDQPDHDQDRDHDGDGDRYRDGDVDRAQVGGFDLEVDAVRARPDELREGQRVWVQVAVGDGARLRAERIEIEPRGGGRPTPTIDRDVPRPAGAINRARPEKEAQGADDIRPDKPEKRDPSGKPETPDRPDKPDKPDKPEKPGIADRPERPELPDKPDKPGRPDDVGPPDRVEKLAQPPGAQPGKPERVGPPEMPEKPDQPGRPDETGKPDKSDKPDKPDKADKPGKPEKLDRPERPDFIDRPEKWDRSEKPSRDELRPDLPDRGVVR